MVGSRRRFLQGAALAAVALPAGAARSVAGDAAEEVRALYAGRHGLPVEWVGVYGGVADALHYAVLAFTSPTRGLVGGGAALARAAAVSGARLETEGAGRGVGMIALGAGAGWAEVERALRAKGEGAVVVVERGPVGLVGEGALVVVERIVPGCAAVVCRPDLQARIAAFGSGVVEGAGMVAVRAALLRMS